MTDATISNFLMFLFAIVLSITVHEFAHAYMADRLGDDVPRSQGRVTLSPLSHLDPMGSLFMVVSYFAGIGIGWGRPVQTNPNNYTISRRLGHSLVTIAGPLSNLLVAGLFALIIRSGVLPKDDAYGFLVSHIIWISLVLFFFNLIPLYPLDGSWLLMNALPPAMAEGYMRFVTQWGLLLFLGLALSGVLGGLIVPPALKLFILLTGSFPWHFAGG